MTDINMSLDDYAKATTTKKAAKAPRDSNTNSGRLGATAGRSTRGNGGRRGGGRQRNRSEDLDPEDTRKGRSDNGQWNHDKFDGQTKRGGSFRGRQDRDKSISRIPGVHIQMLDVHFSISEGDLQELFSSFTKKISLEFDETDRPTGNVILICENMTKAKALINEYSNKSLDGHELKFRILSRNRMNSNSNSTLNIGGERPGPDDSRATLRIKQSSEARGRVRGRGRGAAAATLNAKRAEVKQKRDKKRMEPKEKREKPKPKTATDLDAEMTKFAIETATPDSLDAQMAQFAKERDAAVTESATAPATEAAKAE